MFFLQRGNFSVQILKYFNKSEKHFIYRNDCYLKNVKEVKRKILFNYITLRLYRFLGGKSLHTKEYFRQKAENIFV